MRFRSLFLAVLIAGAMGACVQNAPPPEHRLGYRNGYDMDALLRVVEYPPDPMLRRNAMHILDKVNGTEPPHRVLHCEAGEAGVNCYDR